MENSHPWVGKWLALAWIPTTGLKGQGDDPLPRTQQDQQLYRRATLFPLNTVINSCPSRDWPNPISIAIDDIHRGQTPKAEGSKG